MGESRYHLVNLGPARDQFEALFGITLRERFANIGLDPELDLDVIKLGQAGDFDEFDGLSVGLWLGGESPPDPADRDLLRRLQQAGAPILPLVPDITKFSSFVPEELRPINGRQWDDDRIPGDVLRGFRLTRQLRQAFVSYRRTDATPVAVGVFNGLTQRGFEVFLDTASVEATEPFQDTLWDRMADMDLLVLLDSPNALNSRWVNEELVQVNNLGLGVLQLIWPGHTPYQETHLSTPLPLEPADFVGGNYGPEGRLTDEAIGKITATAEAVRITSLAARRTRVVGELVALLPPAMRADVQPAGPVILRPADGGPYGRPLGLVLPIVGLPDAWSVYRERSGLAALRITVGASTGTTLENLDIEGLAKGSRVRVVYDGLGVRDEHIQRLIWLNGYLPLKTASIDHQPRPPAGDSESLSHWLESLATAVPAGGFA